MTQPERIRVPRARQRSGRRRGAARAPLPRLCDSGEGVEVARRAGDGSEGPTVGSALWRPGGNGAATGRSPLQGRHTSDGVALRAKKATLRGVLRGSGQVRDAIRRVARLASQCATGGRLERRCGQKPVPGMTPSPCRLGSRG